MRFPLRSQALSAALSVSLLCCLPSYAGAQEDQLDPSSTPAEPVQTVSPLPPQPNQIIIPGPIRSFLRMAGISQKIPLEDVLPELARNVSAQGYRQGRETEFLLLIERYVRQARELQTLASPNGEIRIMHCADAGPLLQILGYRLRGECGQKDSSLVTLNPERAFLTIDSGFPLTRLEDALVNDTAFVYPYAPSLVPVLLKRNDWTSLSTRRKPYSEDILDVILHDPHVARLYWALSKMDPETGAALARSAGLWNLLPNAGVLDFYGTEICIRSHKVLVPGGKAAESGWADLAGASPSSPADFVTHLLAQDRGWLAAYFDTLARVDQAQQARLTQNSRLRRFYEAFRDSGPETPAAAASFRKAPALLILFTRQQWLPDGEPRIPGDINLWKEVLGKRGRHVNHPEQVLEAMISYARFDTEDSPLQTYLCLSTLESERSGQKSLSPATQLLMAKTYDQFNSWYPLFAEFPELSDDSITQFIHTAESLDHISKQDLRGDALGAFQANLGIWQILARQGEIKSGQLDSSWQKTIAPFDAVGSSSQLFDAGTKSLGEVLTAATGEAHHSQDEIIDLLAGPPQESAEGKRARAAVARRMRSVMDDQRLTSLDTLQELGDAMNAAAHGGGSNERLRALAGELREFEMPRPIFTESEKGEWAPGIFSQRHAQMQMHVDLAKVVEQSNSPSKMEGARGQLAPFLRDTLVGLNYAYYEPPGSQLLHINPLFVRSHDFSGETVVGIEHVWQTPMLFGQGASAGGGAYLVGSLADLPYALAGAEQDFIAPENVQALIWQELVPTLMASATLSRWWDVSPRELHAVALYQRSGEELLVASTGNPQLRNKVLTILADRLSPQRLERVETARQAKDMDAAMAGLMPSDTFFLAAEFRRRYPQENASWGPSSRALDQLCHEHPAEAGIERISRDFGIPHPTLAQNYGRGLVNTKPFPAFAGYSSRLFGESWDSSNLYLARLADERSTSPETLNVLCPQLTRVMIAKIFATDFEDWPAVTRAMHEAGDELFQHKAPPPPGTQTTAHR
jgi:hypothetical protein